MDIMGRSLCRFSAVFFCFLVFTFLCGPWSPASGDDRVPSKRPKIGVIFGGGGAKGAAHIGVLKVLEEQKIPVDYVAGTSMGAIVGALYASGLSAAELENVITAIDWKDVFKGDPDGREIDYRRKPGRKQAEARLAKVVVAAREALSDMNRGVNSAQDLEAALAAAQPEEEP